MKRSPRGAYRASRKTIKLPDPEIPLLVPKFKEYRRNPALFVREAVKAKPDPWQVKVLEAYNESPNSLVAVAGGTGIGKDAVAAWAIIHFLVCHKHAKVIATSVKYDHLQRTLWGELYKWITGSPALGQLLRWTKTRVEVIGQEESWYATYTVAAKRYSHTTGDAQAEGLAGHHADNLLFVINEASGVDDVYWDTIAMTLTGRNNRCLAIGNPVRVHGRFFDLFHKPSLQWDEKAGFGWRTFNVSQLESSQAKHVAPVLIATHGENSAIVQAKVYGRFPTASHADTCFSYAEVGEAMARCVEDDATAPLQLGVDCARYGDDEMVIVARRGLKQLSLVARPKTSGPEIVGLVANEACRWWRTTEPREQPLGEEELARCKEEVTIAVDETGMGGLGVVDPLVADGWKKVVGIENQQSANDPVRYKGRGAEMWLEDMKQAVRSAELIEDDILRHQLVTRKYKFTGQGQQRVLESKDDMKRRGLGSPDRADALVLAFANVEIGPGMYFYEPAPQPGFYHPALRRRRKPQGLSF